MSFSDRVCLAALSERVENRALVGPQIEVEYLRIRHGLVPIERSNSRGNPICFDVSENTIDFSWRPVELAFDSVAVALDAAKDLVDIPDPLGLQTDPCGVEALQQSTARQEDTFQGAVQLELGEDVNLTALREAALLVAMDHVDEVADQLRERGSDA